MYGTVPPLQVCGVTDRVRHVNYIDIREYHHIVSGEHNNWIEMQQTHYPNVQHRNNAYSPKVIPTSYTSYRGVKGWTFRTALMFTNLLGVTRLICKLYSDLSSGRGSKRAFWGLNWWFRSKFNDIIAYSFKVSLVTPILYFSFAVAHSKHIDNISCPQSLGESLPITF